MKTILVFVGRLIVGLFYLYNGVNHFLRWEGLSAYAGSKGVPLPETAVAGSGLLLLAAGALIILGIYPEIAALALVLFFIPVTFMMHDFWAAVAEMRAAVTVNFSKNMALLGSALMYLGIAKPWPWSLNRRTE